MGHDEHKARAPSVVSCAVVTVSDTRTSETDTGGALIRKLLADRGHRVASSHWVKDDPAEVQKLLAVLANRPEVQAVILSGGTGISKRDGTYEAVAGLLEKRLDGFGELFRSLSYHEIGSAAMMSRAVAGTYRGRVLISIPGSEAAVRLAMEKLILPELGHLIREVNR
ncbi:MAG TPA: MogA/MoaB family molybdenum cofactor biosynthesis protein [Nitrospiria bacterium]|nr:MogA/MoaB family molybdenum cofactor biosynthesis protein [Nitrospiria bacterium]